MVLPIPNRQSGLSVGRLSGAGVAKRSGASPIPVVGINKRYLGGIDRVTADWVKMASAFFEDQAGTANRMSEHDGAKREVITRQA